MSEQTDTRRTEGRGGNSNGTNGTSNGDSGAAGPGTSSNGNAKAATAVASLGNNSNGTPGPAVNANGIITTQANQEAYQQQNQFAAQEPFSSWRTANAGPGAPGGNPAAGLPHGAEAYNNFYYGAGAAGNPVGYSPFSGDIRDSIAAIWSRTSPSGTDTAGGIHAAAAFSATAGGYGQFPDNSAAGQYAANSAAGAGQFAANLTGHFATSELGMFGSESYAAYGQQYGTAGYAPQYTQWPDTQAGGGSGLDRGRGGNTYSYLGNVQAGDDGRGGLGNGGIRGGGGDQATLPISDVQRGLESMKLPGKNSVSVKSHGESNGYSNSVSGGQSSGGSKKMSWASIASQPAKPQPAPAKAKKPGVLAPPTIIPSSKPPVQTPGPQLPPTGDKMVNVGGGLPLQQELPPPMPPAMQGPPPMGSMKPYDGPFVGGPPPVPPMMPPYHAGAPGMGGPPNHYGGQGPRGGHMPRENGPGGMANNNHGPISGQGPRARGGAPNGIPPMNIGSGPNNGGSVNPVNAVNTGGPPGKPHPVLEGLKNINDYNPKSFDLNPKNARYFVIKSFSEDDIHRSIKYEIWCSTEHGNKRLDAAYRERNSKGPIYLLFSVNGSGHFCGMAQMLTGVDYSNTSSSVWVQDKFKGQFKVKWIYVKDVPNGQLRHIRLENNENKPVTNSRDTQEVPPEKGKQVLKTLHSYAHTTSIFDDFIHYEKRQEEEEGKKQSHVVPTMNMKNSEGHRGGHDSGPHGGGRGGRHGERDGHNRSHGGDYHEGPPHRGDRDGGRRGKPRN